MECGRMRRPDNMVMWNLFQTRMHAHTRPRRRGVVVVLDTTQCWYWRLEP